MGRLWKNAERRVDAGYVGAIIRRIVAPSQQFGSPVHCVRFSTDNLVYVCDRVNDRYQVFRKDGTFVSESFFEKDTLLNGSVSDLVLSTDANQMFIFMA